MSRRANTTRRIGTHVRTVAYCRCGRPTRDQAFVCDDCLDGLAQDLRALVPTDRDPGLWHDLWSVIAGERGIDYRALGGAKGGSVALDDAAEPVGAVETGIELNEAATRRAAQIETLIEGMVRECRRLKVSDSAPRGWRPRTRDVPGAAQWLSWRVTAMANHRTLARFPGDLAKAVDAARTTVMPLPGRQWLGACQVPGCNGNLYARRDETYAFCNGCGAAFLAKEMRDWLVGALEDQLCTATEIAEAYTPEPAEQRRVVNRVTQWAHRDQLLGWPRLCDWTPGLCPWPAPDLGHNRRGNKRGAGLVFRFGDAFDLLIAHDAIASNDDQHDPATARRVG